MALLDVQHVKKIYKTRFKGNQVEALKDIHFTVEKGDYVAIMGESGSGKSTLLNILAMLDKPTAGRVYLNGMDTATIKNKDASSFRREKLGFVFQDFNLLDTLSVKDNILLPLVLSRRPLKQMMTQVEAISRQLGIHPLLEKYPYEISGGQKQRLALARVILADRPMIIFDEATSNIDVESEESIWEAIYELSKEKTILVISHRLANVTDAKNIYVMNKGKLVENGTHEELMKNESCYYNMVNKQNELEMIREVC